ncbi:MAG: AMP-binding protein [Armatimonadia bacterium]
MILTNLAAFWHNAVAQYPRAVAVIDGDRSLTYAEADQLIASLAAYFAETAGVRKGDRVLLALPNCLEFILGYWATIRLGAVVAPVNTRLRADELQYVLRNCDPKLAIVHGQTQEAILTGLLAEGLLPHLLGVQTTGDITPFSAALSRVPEGRSCPQAGVSTPAELRPDDLAVILHTSGTTGVPKGAMMRHSDLVFNNHQAILAHSLRHEDLHLLVIPCFAPTASYSLLGSCAYLGCGLVIAPRPNPADLLALLSRHACTTFIGVPTMFHLMTQEPGFNAAELPSLRLIAYSGSPMPARTIRLLRERFPHVSQHNFFGLTETTSITHVLPSKDAGTRADSIGKLLPEVHAKIVDDNDQPVPVGEVGELCLHRSNVIPGYYNRPGLLEESVRGEWFHTGDFARVDEDGYFYVQGRKKEMIIVAGQNVYAHEVEKVILQHDGVRDVAVVGIPATGVRAALGELVKAVVVCQPDVTLRDLDIKRHCSLCLPSYKVPQVVEFRDDLPRNPTGKVLKRELTNNA